jgi:hypothetical protein
VNWKGISGAIGEFMNLGACPVKTLVTVSIEDTENMVVATGLTARS